MAAPELWWVVGGPVFRTGRREWKIVNSPSKPTQGDFVYGPYATKAQAEVKLKQVESPIKPPTLPVPPNPLAGLSDIGKVAHWVGDAVLHIFDFPMWRSIGWILLGVFLMWFGVYLWIRTSQSYESLQNAIVGSVKAL